MVGYTQNNINVLDQLQGKLLVHYCTLLVHGYTITPISYFFWAGGVK